MNAVKVFISIIVLISIFQHSAEGTVSSQSETVTNVTKNMTSSGGIEYSINVLVSNNTISISAYNPNEKVIESGISIRVDQARLDARQIVLESDEKWQSEFQFSSALNVLESEHLIIVSTYGPQTTFSFNRTIDSLKYSFLPYIKNINITNGTIDGHPSTVAEVTVANPSKQTYPTKLMVHTTGTDGSFYPAAVPPGETRTITVELLDERGSRIAGEARLYTERLNQREGAMDQVEFVGRAGGETRHWNTSYQPVRPPWKDDPYRYRNSSISDDGGVVPDDGTLLPYAIVGAVLLGWLLRKLRRRPR